MELFKDEQIANKKIAKYMGDHIDPKKIRLEKIKFQKQRRKNVSDARNMRMKASMMPAGHNVEEKFVAPPSDE